MRDPANLLFALTVASLATHELDAILHHEWRLPLFFFLKPFSDETAYRIFTLLHIPLLTFIIAHAQVLNVQRGFDVFTIVHVGLHIGFRNHPQYEFNNWFSNVLIVGAGVCGALHLLVLQMG
ncbi:MAG: hypothetical protein H7Y11_08055 [Armatimonadetes bacterium]|nr:hypothetical protein [Anaerolineae bacterium]